MNVNTVLETNHRLSQTAEASLCSALIGSQRGLDRISCPLTGSHFSNAALGELYDWILAEDTAGRRVDIFQANRKFPGRTDIYAPLASAGVTVVNADQYAQDILDMHRTRSLVEAYRDGLANLEEDATFDLSAAMDGALRGLEDSAGYAERPDAEVKGAILRALESKMQGAEDTGLKTGITALDAAINGLAPTNLYVVAGRPGMGKSGFVATVASNLAAAGRRVGIISLEMSAEQFKRRIACIRSGLSYKKVDAGQVSKGEFQKFAATVDAIKGVHICDPATITAAGLCVLGRRMARRDKIDLLMVDHIGLADIGSSRDKNQAQALGEFSKALKAMSRELKIPVIALAQLNRIVERRDSKRPSMADIRDSGRIEEDADVVMGLYRAEYYLKNSEPDKSGRDYSQWLEAYNASLDRAEIIVLKNRHGDCETAKVRFVKHTMEFKDDVIS